MTAGGADSKSTPLVPRAERPTRLGRRKSAGWCSVAMGLRVGSPYPASCLDQPADLQDAEHNTPPPVALVRQAVGHRPNPSGLHDDRGHLDHRLDRTADGRKVPTPLSFAYGCGPPGIEPRNPRIDSEYGPARRAADSPYGLHTRLSPATRRVTTVGAVLAGSLRTVHTLAGRRTALWRPTGKLSLALTTEDQSYNLGSTQEVRGGAARRGSVRHQ